MKSKSIGSFIFAIASIIAPFGSAMADGTEYFRVDCRFHNEENIPGINHCYASAVYGYEGGDSNGARDKARFKHVRFGVGCDGQTIYNNSGRIHDETVANRITPKTAAFPALELMPQNALIEPTTYDNSRLDIRDGILEGVCYVQRLNDRDALPLD